MIFTRIFVNLWCIHAYFQEYNNILCDFLVHLMPIIVKSQLLRSLISQLHLVKLDCCLTCSCCIDFAQSPRMTCRWRKVFPLYWPGYNRETDWPLHQKTLLDIKLFNTIIMSFGTSITTRRSHTLTQYVQNF